MRRKRIFSRLWWVGLVILAVLLVQAPVMAQEDVLSDLTGIKAVSDIQMLTIENLKGNFETLSQIMADAVDEIDLLKAKQTKLQADNEELKALVDQQNNTIEEMEKEFIRLNDELKSKIDALQTEINALTADNAELKARNKSLNAQRWLFGLGFLAAAYYAYTK